MAVDEPRIVTMRSASQAGAPYSETALVEHYEEDVLNGR